MGMPESCIQKRKRLSPGLKHNGYFGSIICGLLRVARQCGNPLRKTLKAIGASWAAIAAEISVCILFDFIFIMSKMVGNDGETIIQKQ